MQGFAQPPACRAAAKRSVRTAATLTKAPYPPVTHTVKTEAPDVLYDAVIIGGGMGGLTTAARLVAEGAKVLVLEKYLVPGAGRKLGFGSG